MNTRVRLLALAGAASAACTSGDLTRDYYFTEPQYLAGKELSPQLLNEGRENYVHYCYGCHGMDGDGNGPAAAGLRPPPRDFRQGFYKFTGIVTGSGLPHDEDFKRLIRGGLWGTAMLEWNIPDHELDSIIQYIKTFSEVWYEEDAELGQRVPTNTDPWGEKNAAEAIARGEQIYHGFTTCQQCHAAYLTEQEIYEASVAVGTGKPALRENLYQSVLKESEYTLHGERKVWFLPPDFLYNKVRMGKTVPDLYRTIAAGVPGTAMTSWYNAIPTDAPLQGDKDLWAVAYYVKSLIDMKGTPKAAALRARLANQPEFVMPATTAPAEPAGAEPADGETPPTDGAAAPAPGGAAPTGAAPAAPTGAAPAAPTGAAPAAPTPAAPTGAAPAQPAAPPKP